MKNLDFKTILMATALLTVVATTACESRCPRADNPDEMAIPVKIDWSESGITPGHLSNNDFVHRVSLRLFPSDGSTPFDRYLEGNVTEGTIFAPVGSYSVVVYNEAIDDTYWNGMVRFDNTDSYNLFSANAIRVPSLPFDFYTPHPNEIFAAEPLKLASWSLERFDVTRQTTNALTTIVMRPLVTPVRTVVEVDNLHSAMRMEAALSGLSGKVYMASGERAEPQVTYLFSFTAPVWSNPSHTSGRVERRFLSFGRMPTPATYTLQLGVVFATGERYDPAQPLVYDVTQQVATPAHGVINILVPLTLPLIEGGIGVGGWDDEEHIIQ